MANKYCVAATSWGSAKNLGGKKGASIKDAPE